MVAGPARQEAQVARVARALHAERILARADALERRVRSGARPETATVLAATRDALHQLRLAPRVVVGRARDAGLVLAGRRVSRHHAALFVRRGALWPEDLESTNGTFASGELVRLRALAPGEEVRFGDEPVRFWLR